MQTAQFGSKQFRGHDINRHVYVHEYKTGKHEVTYESVLSIEQSSRLHTKSLYFMRGSQNVGSGFRKPTSQSIKVLLLMDSGKSLQLSLVISYRRVAKGPWQETFTIKLDNSKNELFHMQ